MLRFVLTSIQIVQIRDPQEQLNTLLWDWGSQLLIASEHADFIQSDVQQIFHQQRRICAAKVIDRRNVAIQVLRHCTIKTGIYVFLNFLFILMSFLALPQLILEIATGNQHRN